MSNKELFEYLAAINYEIPKGLIKEESSMLNIKKHYAAIQFSPVLLGNWEGDTTPKYRPDRYDYRVSVGALIKKLQELDPNQIIGITDSEYGIIHNFDIGESADEPGTLTFYEDF